jgi:glycosyltransferase involved in cell wall biosynthesis
MMATIVAIPFLPKADIVLSTSPQFFNGLAGFIVSRLKCAPWVLEIRDLWPESILTVGAIKNKTVIQTLQNLEMFAYRRADQIVPVTDAFKKYMVNKGIDKEKIKVIKNGVDLNFYKDSPDNQSKILHVVQKNTTDLLEIDLTDKFVVSYVGTHGMAHNLETVIAAANELRDQPNIIFLLVGDGAKRNKLVEIKEKMHVNNLIMLDQQPKKMMPLLWEVSDVSMVLLKKSELFKTVIPSKIFESLAMKKPIILGVEGESQEIIETANAGICIEPENHKQLADAVLFLYENPEVRKEYGNNGKSYVEANFDRQLLARKYLNVLEEVIAEK